MTGPTLPGECIASIRLIPSPVPTATSLPCLLSPLFGQHHPAAGAGLLLKSAAIAAKRLTVF